MSLSRTTQFPLSVFTEMKPGKYRGRAQQRKCCQLTAPDVIKTARDTHLVINAELGGIGREKV